MGAFARLRERAKKAAAQAWRKLFRRPEPEKTIREKTKEIYSMPPGWTEEHEAALKAKDMEWRKQQQEAAYKTFAETYDMSRLEWEEMLDGIGGAMSEMGMYLEGGSPTVVKLWQEYHKNIPNADPQDFKDLFNKTRELFPGQNQKELADNMYDMLDIYKTYHDKVGGDVTEFIEFFKDVKKENPSFTGNELKERALFEIERDSGE